MMIRYVGGVVHAKLTYTVLQHIVLLTRVRVAYACVGKIIDAGICRSGDGGSYDYYKFEFDKSV
jgi:hypothetical protein